MSNQTVSPQDKYQEYLKALVSGVTLALKDLQEPKEGTNIYIIAAADVANLIDNKNVLSKVVNYYWPLGPQKQTVTCEDVRNQTVGGAEKLANMCDYILGTQTSDRERIGKIKNLHQAVVDAQRAAVFELNKKMEKRNIYFYFLDDLLETNFTADDISPDCFHPSVHGHKKMAQKMISEMGLSPQQK